MNEIYTVFKMDSLPDNIRKNTEEICIDRVAISSYDNAAYIDCHAAHFIHPHFLDQAAYYITREFFIDQDKKAYFKINYPEIEISSLADLWQKYGQAVIFELSVKDQLYSYAFDKAIISFDNDIMEINLSDDFLSKKVASGISDDINEILYSWFKIRGDIRISYHETAVEHNYDGDVNGYFYYNDNMKRKPPEKPVDLNANETIEKKKKEKKEKDREKAAAEGENKYRKPKVPDDPNIFYGRNFSGDTYRINELFDGINDAVITGMITFVEERELKSGKFMFIFSITDFTDTINGKIFLRPEELDSIRANLKPDKFVSLCGNVMFDTYDKEVCISQIKGIKKASDTRVKRMDTAEIKRVELHAHTQMSDMDAVTDVKAYVKRAFEWGHPAVAITDHGVVQAFTEASHAIDPKKLSDEEKARFKDFKIIYGCEGYLVNDDDLFDENGNCVLDEESYVREIRGRKYYHIIFLCKNDLGRANLYKLVSDSHLKYFSRRPKVPKSELLKNREGIIIGSACEAGELFRAILNKESEEYIEHISKLYDYYEIQPIYNNYFLVRDKEKYPEIKDEKDLQALNKKIVELADKHHKLCVATCDVHFLDPEDEIYRRIIMAGKGFSDADLQPPLFFRTTEEMLAELYYLGPEKAFEVAVTNTNLINDMIEKIAPVRPDKCPPVIENSDNDLRDMCYKKAISMYGDPLPDIVKNRLDKELNSIISNGYSVMYIIAQKLVKKSNDDGYLVGSRGSVGSSFVATMSSITEVNPLPPHYYCPECHYTDFDSDIIKNALENQLSGYDLPDMNCPKCGHRLCRDGQNIPFETFLGFNGDKEPDIDLNFSGEYQSKAHAYTEVIFGEGHTFKAGTIGTLADKTAFGFIKKYYEDKGIEKRVAEINRLVKGCVGVRRTTGQHPGGIVVLPHGEKIYTFTPVQHPANDMESDIITTHFDYHSIDHNLLKLDILGHDDPTMIRFLEDLTGEDAKTWPMDDAKVISLFNSCEALGVKPEQIGTDLGSLGLPELGTNFVMNMLRECKPKSFSDMIRISGLSHGTDVWTNNAQTLIKEGKCELQTAICTRDDIMTFLILKGIEAGKSFKIMESVRKGKGLQPEMEEVMKANNIPDWYIWSCKMIKYMFPKAHACAYVMMAFRIAYCKVYHPLAYYAAYFSIRAKDFDYEVMAQGLDKLQDWMDKTKEKINNKTASQKEEAMYDDSLCVREMYARGFEFTPINIYEAKANRFKIKDGKLMPSLQTINGMGEKAAVLAEEEAKKAPFVSRNDYKNRGKIPQSVIDTMTKYGILDGLPEDEQLSLFDLFG